MMGRDDDDSEYEDDEIDEEEEYAQHLMQGIKANMPRTNPINNNDRIQEAHAPTTQNNNPPTEPENTTGTVNRNRREQNIPTTQAERLALLRKNVMAGREEEDEIDEDELNAEEAYAQRLMQGIKANMPRNNPRNNNDRIQEAHAPTTENNNPPTESQNPTITINQKNNEQAIPTTQAERLALLRKNVMAGRDEEEIDEDELAEAQEAEDAIVNRLMTDIKANAPRKKEANTKFTVANLENINPNFVIEEDDDELEFPKKNPQNPKANETQESKDTKKDPAKKDKEEAPKVSKNDLLFMDQLNTYNKMYKTKVDAKDITSSVTDSLELLKSDNEEKRAEGQKQLEDAFKKTLKQAFDIEKQAAYEEQRLPDYTEIIKSTNDLFRTAMFAFTDLYQENRTDLFKQTAFGGANPTEMAKLTTGDSLWSKDQRSNEAWQIQSQPAKNIADEWMKDKNPYERMIKEMDALVKANKEGTLERKAMYDRLAAAEWMLLNNDKMMIDNPEDPLNKMPNWGTRYWKSITQAREALGVPKHISMRELIQGNYAEMAKVASNAHYNKKQIEEQIMAPQKRALCDSMEKQSVDFTIRREGISNKNINNEQKAQEIEMTSTRTQITVPECDEKLLIQEQPKVFNFQPTKEMELEITNNAPQQ